MVTMPLDLPSHLVPFEVAPALIASVPFSSVMVEEC